MANVNDIDTFPVVIASGQSLSGAANFTGMTVTGLQLPATWTAADVTFAGSIDGVTYGTLKDAAGAEVRVVLPVAGDVIQLSGAFFGIRYLKVRSGTVGSPVAQGAARTVNLVGRPV